MTTLIVIILFIIAAIAIGAYYENVRNKEISEYIDRNFQPVQHQDFDVIPSNFNSVKLIIGKLISETEHIEKKPEDFNVGFDIPVDVEKKMLKLNAITERGVVNYYNQIKSIFTTKNLILPELKDTKKITYISSSDNISMIYSDTILTFQFYGNKM